MISYRRNVLDIHDSGEKVLTEKASKDYQVNTSLSHQANGRVAAGQAVGSAGTDRLADVKQIMSGGT